MENPSPVKAPGGRTRKGLSLALTSGVLACLAGTFGKLAMTESDTLWACESVCESSFSLSRQDAIHICAQGSLAMRILAFGLMILMNGIMWTTFVKALRFCNTSLEATVTNTAANFFASAIVGRLVFDESVGVMWWLGTLLIIFGLGLMNYTDKGGTLHAGTLLRNNKLKRH